MEKRTMNSRRFSAVHGEDHGMLSIILPNREGNSSNSRMVVNASLRLVRLE